MRDTAASPPLLVLAVAAARARWAQGPAARRKWRAATPTPAKGLIMTETDDPVWAQLQLVENRGADGILHIALVGELDLAVAAPLSSHFDQLGRGGTRARVDLSRLEFIDVSGVRALMRAARHRGRRGEQLLEFGHEIPPIIRRMIDLVGAAQTLWPINHSLK